jgi:RHS repeat-associated protein
MLLDGGDSHQSGDDKCVQITYATPAGTNERVLLAVSSLRTYANRDCTGAPRAADYFEYDCPAGSTSCPTVSAANPTGSVSKGFLTGHSVENRATDDGTLLGTARVLDSTLDTFGNPVTMTMTREEGATRTLTLTYDSFGIALVSARSAASGGPTTVPSMTTTITLDPLTMEVLGKTDPTGTRAGATYDGFGRILLSTITPPGGTEGALSSTVYSGFAVGQTGGRRITRTAFTDPVPVATATAAAGRTRTLFLDELGRSLRTEVALGADYAATPTLVVGKRVYDDLGRVVFEADPYTSNQDASSAYGTTSFFAADGTPTCSVRAYGQQPTLVATTDEASERYPTCASRSFSDHVEIVTTQDAASMLAGSPQEGVQKITFLSATGRTLKRYTRNSAFATQEEAHFGYDFVGNLTSMRRFWYSSGIDSVTTTWRYDSRGRMIQLNEPASLPQYLSYDNWSQLVSSRWTDTSASPVVDRVMAHRYDALGRLVHTEEQREDHALGTTETDPEAVYDYLYDTPVVVPSDGQVNPTYVLGRMAKATSPKSSVTFGYDAFGRTNARTFYDDQGGPNIEMRTFHGDGSLQTLRFVLPDRAYKGERVDYPYDSAGRGRTVKFTDGSVTQSLLNASMIDGLGRLREAQYGSTIYTASYADVGRRLPSDVTVSSLLALSAGGGTRKISFQPAGGLASAYDPVGRERVRTETENGNPSAQPVFRTYDAIGRLASMSGPQPVTFQYDTLGNLLTQSYSAPFTSKDVGVGYDQPGLGSDDRDRMCRISYANAGGWGACKVLYDGIGDVVQMPTAGGGTRSLTYGASGQAHTISNSEGSNAHFFYDAFGAVQQLVVAGSTSDTRRDRHFGEHLLAHDEGAGNSVLTRRIELPGGSAIKHGASGKWVFQIGEQRGARFFIDQDGVFAQDVDYSPYGQSTSSGPASKPGSPLYSSVQWNDGDALAAFGVSQLGARIYDPVVGRFLSRDPLLTPDTGATTNPYAFANNDPINGSDPTGLSPLVPHTTRFGCCKVWRSIFNEQEDLLDFSAEDTAIMLGFTWGLVQRHGGHSALPTAADLPAGLNLDLTLVRNAAVLWTLTAKWNADPSHFTSITPVEYFSWYGLGPATNTLGIRLLSIGDGVIRGLMVADGLELADLARSLGAAAVSKVLTRELTEDASGLASRRWGSLASEREIISSVNPHGFQDACGQCAIALDSTWAGNPTTVTRNLGPMSTEEILEHYGKNLSDLIPAKSQREVAAALKARGPGARAIIFADPANPAELGHVLNARNEGGVLTFADPSYGDIGSFTGYNQIWFFWTW